MISCGKAAVGISVSNGNLGWDNLIQFAQQQEDSNKPAKTEEKAKKKVARELQSLKSALSIMTGVQEQRVVKPVIR